MTDNSLSAAQNKSLRVFFDAAGKALARQLAQEEKDKKLMEREKMLAEKQEAKEKARQEKKKHRVFADYFNHLSAIATGLASLPPKDGNEFFVRVDFDFKTGLVTNPTQDKKARGLHMWVLHTHAYDENANEAPLGLYMPAKNKKADGEDDVRLAFNQQPWFCLELDQTKDSKKIISYLQDMQYVSASNGNASSGQMMSVNGKKYNVVAWKDDVREHKTLRSAIKPLAAWFAEVAPDRMDELEKLALGITIAEKVQSEMQGGLKMAMDVSRKPLKLQNPHLSGKSVGNT